MKTIAQYVQQGISTLADLQAALQTAMQLEFSTIPPYLCAQWSIDQSNDPSGVTSTIQGIVVQEMFHFALAGNLLSVIGGTPSIANSSFVWKYPATTLPGGIAMNPPVPLAPLSKTQLQIFMNIEFPEFPPVAFAATESPATIGAFYDTIATGLTTVNPQINGSAPQVTTLPASPPPANGRIQSMSDAQAAIARIKQEGEGTQGTPDQPPSDAETFAHYYLFKEILEGAKLKLQSDGTWQFNGAAITFPGVKQFAHSTVTPDPSSAFNQALSQLLTSLQTCWTAGGPNPDIGKMFALQIAGQALIQGGIRPEFLWSPSS